MKFISLLLCMLVFCSNVHAASFFDSLVSRFLPSKYSSKVIGTCTMKTDYPVGNSCSSTVVTVTTQAQLDAYMANYGLAGSLYKSVNIAFNLDSPDVQLHAPCQIQLQSSVTLSGQNICVDGRTGVLGNAATITGGTVSLLSQSGDVSATSGAVLNANQLTMSGFKAVKLGVGSSTSVNGPFSMTSNGDLATTEVTLVSGATVSAQSLAMASGRGVTIGQDLVLNIPGTVSMSSTGTTSDAKVSINSGVHLTSNSLSLSGDRAVSIGQNVVLNISGAIVMNDIGTFSDSTLSLASSVQVTAGSLSMTGNRGISLGGNTTLNVTNGIVLSTQGTSSDSSVSLGQNTQLNAGKISLTSGRSVTIATGSVVHAVSNLNIDAPTTSVANDATATGATQTGSYFNSPNLPPVATFTANPSSSDVNVPVSFVSTSTDPNNNIETYQWDFGDGTTLNTSSLTVSHTYTAAGTKVVRLTAIDALGASGTKQINFVVNDLPVASFTISSNPANPNQEVTFTSTSVVSGGSIVSYIWNFGDGATSTTTSNTVSHAYTASGSFTVGLTIADSGGGTSSIQVPLLINNPPVASFTASSLQVVVNQSVTFTSNSTDSDGTIVKCVWDYGDASASEEVPCSSSAVHAFTTGGAHVVTLSVTDNLGATGTAQQTVTVTTPPIASFTVSPNPAPRQVVTFTSTSSAPNGSISNYSWNFGDGVTLSTTNPVVTHTYQAARQASVTLTVTDNLGMTSNTSRLILVDIAPIANFTVSKAITTVGTAVTLLSNSTTQGAPIVRFNWNFGDGTTLNTTVPTAISHTYSTAGTKIISLVVTDQLNVSSIITSKVLNVVPPLVVGFTTSPSVVSVGEPTTFTSTSTDPNGNIITYLWNFGDGGPVITANPSIVHTFTSAATRSVTLTVSDNLQLTGTKTTSIVVGIRPVADFDATPNPVTLNSTVNFSSTSTATSGPIVGYAWDFGDGTTDTASGPGVSHSYSSGGTKSVGLTVTDSRGAVSTIHKDILVNLPPVASFGVTPNPVDINKVATFVSTSNDSDGTIDGYTWDFGDGTTDSTSGPFVTHSYAEAGLFTVKLNAVDNLGASSQTQTLITVLPASIHPIANFVFSPVRPTQSQVLTFTSTSTTADPHANIASWEWNFGDGTIDSTSGAVASHRYSATGSFSVRLTVTDNRGASAQVETVLDIQPSNQPPISKINVDSNPVLINQLATFISASQDPDGQIASYAWDFGDGVTDNISGAIVTHVYNTPGFYSVGLIVTDDAGATASSSILLQVLAVNTPPIAQFNFLPSTSLIGEQIIFASTSTDKDGKIVQWAWDFGDGTTDSTSGVYLTHSYVDAGTYTVSLTVTDNRGASTTQQAFVIVRAPNLLPIPSFSVTPITAKVGEAINVTSTATDPDGTVVKYLWDFGDANVDDSNVAQATHSYVTPGFKTITLTVTDDRGGSSSGTITAEIKSENQAPIADFTPNIATATAGQTVTFTSSSSSDSDGNIVSYSWNFGDGTTDTTSGAVVSHVFSSEGFMNVVLTVTDNLGAVASKSLPEDVVSPDGALSISGVNDPGIVVINSPTPLSLLPGNEKWISAVVRNSSGKLIAPNLVWSSSSPSVASVTSNGLDTATVRAQAPGATTITASIGGVVSAAVTINVSEIGNGLTILDPPGGFLKVPNGVVSGGVFGSQRVGVSNSSSTVAFASSSLLSGQQFSNSLLIAPGLSDVVFQSFPICGVWGCNTLQYYSATKAMRYFDGRGQSLAFDGIDDIASLKFNQIPDSSSFSISFWRRWVGTPSNGPLLTFPAQGNDPAWTIESKGQAVLFNVNTSTGLFSVATPRSQLEGWEHIAVVYSGVNNTLKIFQDGALRSSIVVSGTVGRMFASRSGTLGGQSFVGNLDELRFWNVALTDSEIQSEMFSPLQETDPRLASAFSFDNANSQIISDDTGMGSEIIFGATRSRSNDDPRLRFASQVIARKSISANMGGTITSGTIGNAFPGIGSGAKVAIEVPPKTLVTDADLVIELADPSTIGNYFGAPELIPSSPIVRVHPGGQQINFGSSPATISLPFDSKATQLIKAENIFLYREDYSTSIIHAYRPFSVDMERGIAVFPFMGFGSFWIGVEKGLRPDIRYLSPNVNESWFSGYIDYRTFSTSIAAQGAAPFNMVLDVDTDGARLLGAWCGNRILTNPSVPITITDLQIGLNRCYFDYSLSLGQSGTLHLNHSVEITVK